MLAGVGWLNASGDRDKDQKIRILWTNDLHGYFKPLYQGSRGTRITSRWRGGRGRPGGFASRRDPRQEARGEKPERTLLPTPGDTRAWTTGVAVFDGGATIVNVMNALKYDAMAPGNVDFLSRRTLSWLASSRRGSP